MIRKTMGIILIIAAIVLGVLGFQSYQDSSASVSIGNLELSAKDKSSQNTAYIYFGLCALSLLGGVALLRK